ncbi:retrograde regulation protein 2 [Polychaeton citri CBS 116435]|uniref:Retrograde regulation protein 2 n=1 Tax=Polychaeton citri CBS 116435 TaxID=1314669 RepID=A0A9P4QIW9_9PEZI|nr:retrograde regulation protein 2 [Polychaeton citri CBS 116435]
MTTHGGLASPRVSHDSIEKQKESATYLDEVELAATEEPKGRLQAPEIIRNLTPDERKALEKRLTRKIDMRLLPPVIIMYILNYLDRNSIATARLAGNPGMQKELNMTNSQYETAVSILFVGYILMQVPSNLFLNKVGKPALYLPGVMAVWGAISACTAAANSYAGLVVVRFFLGFVEAAYFPGCLFYLSCWYTRKELAFRSAILYSGSLISGAFAGLIAAGITNGMDGKAGISAWRWLFIIEGVITVAVALVAFFILPNFPRTTTWLKEDERELAVWRLQEDIGVDDWSSNEKQSFFHGFYLALIDIKVWILMLMFLGVVSAASITNFFPSVVETLGYDHMTTLLLTAPPYVLAVITTFANAWHADKTGERFLHIVIPLVVGIAAFILAACTTSMAPRYVAMMIMLSGLYCGYVIILSWISNSIPRPPAKRAAALALINAVSNSSSIYASYLYSGAPRYTLAFSVNIGTLVLSILAALALRIWLTRENRKMERGQVLFGGIGGTFRYLV